MSTEDRPLYRGGCQCGAVRFRVEGALGKTSICHCRMCQKAFGNFFAPLVHVEKAQMRWTKREPSRFQSSEHVLRGFCEACGTPLTYEADGGVSLAVGAFDDPSEVVPEIQYGVESRLAYTARLADLPERPLVEDPAADACIAEMRSFQHPDHDRP